MNFTYFIAKSIELWESHYDAKWMYGNQRNKVVGKVLIVFMGCNSNIQMIHICCRCFSFPDIFLLQWILLGHFRDSLIWQQHKNTERMSTMECVKNKQRERGP